MIRYLLDAPSIRRRDNIGYRAVQSHLYKLQSCNLSTSKAALENESPPHFPVGIVGGGPVGLLMSALLSSKGIQHCLLERRLEPTTHPQAHFMSARTMEILKAHVPRVFNDIVSQVSPSVNWRYIYILYYILNPTGY